MITLRDYQTDCIDRTRQALRQHRNVLLQSPTGSGKTAMASFMLDQVTKKQKRGLFICHRRELVDQTAKTFDKVGIDYGYIANGYPMNPYQPIQICSIDTLKNRLDRIEIPDFCIWDEAHHLGAAGWERVHEYYSKSFHVGLSATPTRLDGRGLDDRFQCLVPGPSTGWLIENGFLANYKLFSVPGADLSGLHTRMGDYVKSESEEAMDKPTITGDIIDHWRKHAIDKLTIGFAVSVNHSKHLCEQFRAAGIVAVHLDGTTPKPERQQVLRALARGDIRLVFNVGLFAEGFDIAANSGMDVTIGCVIDAAPTQSLGAWLQRCGRAFRPQDGHAVILDHAGNWGRHGSPCQDREWTLEGRDKKRHGATDSEPDVLERQCPSCYAVHKPMPACPECGHAYKIKARVVQEVEGELQEIDPEEMKRQQRMDQGRARGVEDMIKMGYSKGRAEHILKARQEKLAMQTQLHNLFKGAQMAGVEMEFTIRDIAKMKPKKLRENISYLVGVMDG